MNLPVLWFEAMTNKKTVFATTKIKDGFKAMVEPTDFAYRVLGRRISFFNWLKERKRCDCLFYKNSSDKRPTRFFGLRKLFKLV